MKSQEELDVLLEEIDESDESRAEKLALLERRGLLRGTLSTRLIIVQRRHAEVQEAELMAGGWFVQRARRSAKHGLVDAVRRLDELIDRTLEAQRLVREG